MKVYDVMFDGKVMGNVYESCEGLYTHFHARCQLPDAKFYRLYLVCAKQELDLGVCVPTESGYSVNKRIQNKQIPIGEKAFYIVTAKKKQNEGIIPVTVDSPFAYISQLEHAYFRKLGDGCGILFKISQDP